MALYLTEGDVAALLSMNDAVQVVEDVFKAQATGSATNESRRRVRADGTTLHVMSAALSASNQTAGYLGCKTYTVKRGVARFFVSLFSSETGELLAFIEADRLGQIRTGAASGVATRYLANKSASRIGIYGSGGQARTQLLAVCKVRDIHEISVFSPNVENRRRFATAMRDELEVDAVTAVDRPEAAAEGADIVITITTSRDPVLSSSWLAAGTHINAAGGNSLLRRELDDETLRRASLITVDSIDQAHLEAGELVTGVEKGVITWERVRELRHFIGGEPGAARKSTDEITIFKSLGLAIEDVAAASLVYERALARKIGREF